MDFKRLDEIFCNVLEWTIQHDDEFVQCVIKASGMTREEIKEYNLEGYIEDENEYELIIEYEDGSYDCVPYLDDLDLAIKDAESISSLKEYKGTKVVYVCIDQCFRDGRENINIWDQENN